MNFSVIIQINFTQSLLTMKQTNFFNFIKILLKMLNLKSTKIVLTLGTLYCYLF